MKESTHNILVMIVVLFLITIVFLSVVIAFENQHEERSEVCKRIGAKTGLEYFNNMNGDCGWEIDCYYQCKFIDNNGNIITKNVD